ncbi:hypothetical protein K435DRAFT_226172 [Dendrothele bispora CBS 962.96]|uniref:Uncharacterized protein n=1 Tax=Dendrothele bispora (strain CBS 962.96) TaxID=1314807 RepID=A0A4S8LQG4_DENBC|nr:hypothetical protein K435DRAFT_226172 [Dendrothele bispora CBS 962.96]
MELFMLSLGCLSWIRSVQVDIIRHRLGALVPIDIYTGHWRPLKISSPKKETNSHMRRKHETEAIWRMGIIVPLSWDCYFSTAASEQNTSIR